MSTLSANEVHWDLTRLYSGVDDPRIARAREEIEGRIAHLERARGTIEGGDARHIALVLEELEALLAVSSRLATFAELLACVDEEDVRKRELREDLQALGRRWQARLVFVDLEIQRIPDDRFAAIADDRSLAPYRHYIRHQKKLARYTLSEREEQVAIKKNAAGRDAMVRFREEFAARMDFGRLVVAGEDREMTEAELRALLRDPDPGVREAAATRIYETYGKNRDIFHFLYSNVVRDYAVEREMRGYARPIDIENTANEVELRFVEEAIAATRRHLPLVHEFYGLKARALGLARLRTCDRLAPITGERPRPIVWSEARRLITGALDGFDPGCRRTAELFWAERRVDASVHKGKRGGGFCSPIAEDDPYVLLNYTDDAESMTTLAHELGHAVHFAFARRKQRYLEAYGMSKVLAETASEFFEAILLDHLTENGHDPVLERFLLGHAIDRFLSTVNRQLTFTEFELAAHGCAEKGPISADMLSDTWERLSKEHYGPHVDLLPGERVGWATIPHFSFNPFYCVSYALSHVVVLALHARWREEGAAFVPGYCELLEAGWSGTPEELLRRAGIDLSSPAIYDAAYRELASRIERLEGLLALR